MAEALTESFCERCGTRYEFTAPTRLNPLRKTRGLVTGLKNYIMSQDALSDSVGDAMRSEEEELAAAHLEAFHAAFNFCIDCRQYTCTNCWNDAAGRCRSCAPVAGTDDLLERFEASFAAGHQPVAEAAPIAELGSDDIGRRLGIDTWPTSDLPVAETNGTLPPEPAWPEARPVQEAEPWTPADAATEPISEPVGAAASPEFAAEPIEPVAPWSPPVIEPEPVAAEAPEPAPVEAEPIAAEVDDAHAPIAAEAAAPEAAPPHLTVLGWDDDHAFELLPEPVAAEAASPAEPEPAPEPVAAWEPPLSVDPAPEPAPEPVAAWEPPLAVEPAPEPVSAAPDLPSPAEPEPIAAHADLPEPVAAAEAAPPEAPIEPPVPRTLRPIGDTILHLPQAEQPAPPAETPMLPQAAEDPTAAARRAQLDLLGLDDPGQGSVQAARPNVIPYRSSGAAASPVHSRAQSPSAFWDASAREVAGAMSAIGVQSCGQCGLSLSASARFCRRCGTRQAQPA